MVWSSDALRRCPLSELFHERPYLEEEGATDCLRGTRGTGGGDSGRTGGWDSGRTGRLDSGRTGGGGGGEVDGSKVHWRIWHPLQTLDIWHPVLTSLGNMASPNDSGGVGGE